ncbi:MAG: hypothetical protein HY956_03475 [Deltaproteobacteria bacterium]|nr:hypothetical protein [Deltaproteobacteria bacterium]
MKKTAVAHHTLNVTVDIGARKVEGFDRMSLKMEAKEVRLLIRAGSSIDRIEVSGAALEFTTREIPKEGAGEAVVTLPSRLKGKDRVMLVRFHGTFPDASAEREKIKRGVAYVEDGVIGEEGVFLPSSSLWYPQEESGITPYDVTVTVPTGYTAIMEGEPVKAAKKGANVSRWKTEHPIDGMDLVAARYAVEKEVYKGVAIYTYFFEKDPKLSRLYIEKTRGYLDLYQGMIGPYPFRKFAVVENFLPTGYGMPSFTLLGSAVLRLPFIPDTSLGHEIAHNWWGNSVFVDNSEGNWSEALTTYTADYLYAGRGGVEDPLEFRRGKLIGYRNFAGREGISLKDFKDSTSTASRAVGYNKGVMVFNMLETLLGPKDFGKGIKEFYASNAFRRASWSDIEAAFEHSAGRDLKWFFDEWVRRSGGPEVSIGGVEMKGSAGGYTVSFEIRQNNSAPYILDLPVLFTTAKGAEWSNVRVGKAVERVTVELRERPVSFEVDPDYQTFRLLSEEEVPPSLAGFFGDKDGVIIVPMEESAREKYSKTAQTISNDYAIRMMTDSDNIRDYLKEKSVFIFGGRDENRLFSTVEPYISKELTITADSYEVGKKIFKREGSMLAVAVKNPFNPAKTVCFFTADAGPEKITGNGKRLRYFSDSSYIVFTPDGKVEKGTFAGKKTLRHEFEGR